LWAAEERGRGSVVHGFLRGEREDGAVDDYALGNMVTAMDGVSVYSFKDGIRTITDALVRELKRNPNVQLQSGVGVSSLHLNPLRKTFEVCCSIRR
jgi:oxygen-dependent protoporphyrinogen oxidase